MMKQVKNTMPLKIFALLCGLMMSVGVFAQEVAISGHVKDVSGEPVIGVTVRIVGQQGGAVTDFNGNFTVKVSAGTALQFSYLGFQTITAKAEPNMVVVLKDDAAKSLNEVVVIGYGVAKKSDLTGSVAALKPDTKNKGLVVNPQDMMAGKIAGVSVISNDGAPGTGAQIRIRGGSSLNASNDPLIVIDGVAMDNEGVKGLSNPLSMINPQDIESFNVLKDASATAIYGSRGSNGVIIITTKKGQKGQLPSISYAGSLTISARKKTLEVMNGDRYRTLIKDLWGENSDAYKSLGTADTDWQSLIYRTAVSQDHNITLSGAAKNLPYRVSLGYTGQQGILKTSDFNRFTAALNLNPSLLDDHLKLNLNAKGMYAKTRFADGEAIGAACAMDPTQDPYAFTSPLHLALLGKDLDRTMRNFGGYFEWPQASPEYNDSTWPYSVNTLAVKNPLAILNERDERARSKSFVGSAELDYKLHGFEDLRLHLTLGADVSQGKQQRTGQPSSPQFLYYGSYGYEDALKRNLSLSTYAQYYKDFTEKHHFDAMLGYEWQHFWRKVNSDYVGYYPQTQNQEDLRGQERPHVPFVFKTENYLVSFFGRANYTYDDKHYLTLTVRHDGSSRFKNHWSTFPSFAYAWRASQEEILKNLGWISDLKLRLGWGMTGQQNVNSDYAWIPSYSISVGTNGFYPIIGDGVLYRPNAYTPDLKWETTTTSNIGLDWGVCKQRFTGTIDLYYRRTTDLLNYAPTQVLTSYRNNAWQNIGSLKNTGVEITLDWKAIQTKDLYWTLSYNFTYNHNEILDLSGVSKDGKPVPNTGIKIDTDKYLQYNVVGKPANSFYVYQQVYDSNGKPIEGLVVDRDGNGQITSGDCYFYKNPMPPVTMGLSSRFEYKNIDFGISLRANIGNYVFDNVSSGNGNVSKYAFYYNNYLTNRPVSVLANNWQTYETTAKMSDYYLRNASFIKCDNITLGYSFADLFKAQHYKGMSGRVYATVSNVFTITKYQGLDPEINNGYDNQIYPRPISFIMGLNLNF